MSWSSLLWWDWLGVAGRVASLVALMTTIVLYRQQDELGQSFAARVELPPLRLTLGKLVRSLAAAVEAEENDLAMDALRKVSRHLVDLTVAVDRPLEAERLLGDVAAAVAAGRRKILLQVRRPGLVARSKRK